MRIDEFLEIMQKVKRFKIRLEQENITEEIQETILKVYISDLTDRINTDLLEVI